VHMTTIMAVVGGPLLIALVDLIRRRKSRLERTSPGFPALPVLAFPGGRALVKEPAVDQPVFSVVDVVPPVVEQVVTSNPVAAPVSSPILESAPAVAGIEGVARVARIATPNLPLARSMPSQLPRPKFLPHTGPRGFAIQSL
jgi:hypothetical protein